MGDDTLNKDDIYLMLKSYENQVQYTTRLYDRQDRLILEQEKIVNNLVTIVEKQSDLARSIDSLVKTLIEQNNHSIGSMAETKSSVVNNAEKIQGISGQINDLKVDSIKDHGELKTGLIVISVGLSSVVIALIVALGKIWEKSDIIDSVAKFIGVQ